MKPLKFLFITTFFPPYHIGGDAIQIYHLSCELAKKGHTVHVIHYLDAYRWKKKGYPKSTTYKLPDNVILHPICSTFGKIILLITYITGIPFFLRRKILRIVQAINPDVIHHHNIAGFGPWIFGLDAPIRLYTAHDHWLICQMNGFLNHQNELCGKHFNCIKCSIYSGRFPQLWRYTNYIHRKLDNINFIISPSEYLKNRLELSGILVPITVIPNFIPEPIESGKPIIIDPYFLYVGVIEKHKGILDLIEEFFILNKYLQKKLIVVGDGSELNTIQDFILKNNCSNSIQLLGRIDGLALITLYSNAEAVIIPSICYENSPMVAIEAIANGTPIITSNVGGLPEITKKFNLQYIFKDKNELRSILLNFEKKTNETSTFLRELYINNYSPKNLEIYLSLLMEMKKIILNN